MLPKRSHKLADALVCRQPGCICRKPSENGDIKRHCPAHDDEHPSLSVTEQGGKLLVHCHAGCEQDAVIATLRERGLWPSPGRNRHQPAQRVTAMFDYHNAKGELLYRVEPGRDGRKKKFRVKHSAPDGSGWHWGSGGDQSKCSCQRIDSVLFGLPDLLAAPPDAWIFIPEGEGKAKRLRDLRLAATTNSGGAGKWPNDHSALENRKLALLPDNDDAGHHHARMVARKPHGEAAEIRIVQLPELPEKGDVIDWLDAGHTKEELLALVEAGLVWKPDPAQNPTSAYKGLSSEVRFMRVNAGALQISAGDAPRLKRLPFLGNEERSPFIEGWSHLLTGYPKTGETELLTRLVSDWSNRGLGVLYLSEEPQSVWRLRLWTLPKGFDNVDLVFAMGCESKELRLAIQSGRYDVVVVDTLRLLRLPDENDNAVVDLALTPLVLLCRSEAKPLVMAHHGRKGGGLTMLAAAGAHAFVGIADVALELQRDKHMLKRRQVRGWGRVVNVCDFVYELQADGVMKLMGDPHELEFEEVKGRVREVLKLEWQQTNGLRAALDDPEPSADQVNRALHALANDGWAERDPPLSEGSKPGKRYRWRIANLTSDEASPYSGGEVLNQPEAPANPSGVKRRISV